MLAALEFLNLSFTTAPFDACGTSGPRRCKTAVLGSFPNRTHSHRFFYEQTLAVTSYVLGSDHFQLFLQLSVCPAVAKFGACAKNATAMGIWVRRRPHAERRGVSSFPSAIVPLHIVALTFSQDSRRVWRSWLHVG